MIPVSVLIPCFNCDRFIGATLDSVLRQKGIDLELIVLNDGSTDNSLNVIETYENSIKIIDFKTHRGVHFARNHLLDQAKKEFVWFLDADDQIVGSDHTIYARASFLRDTHSSVAGCYGNFMKRIWKKNCIIADNYIDLELGGWLESMVLNQRIPTTSNLLWKKSAIEKWDENIKAMMDGFYCLDVYKKGKRIVHCASKDYSILVNVNWSNHQITHDKTRLRFYREKLKQDFSEWLSCRQEKVKKEEALKSIGTKIRNLTQIEAPTDPVVRTNLFIIGAPRCGTTSLWYYLKRKQEILGSRRKEILFFDTPLHDSDFWGSLECRFFQKDEPSWSYYKKNWAFHRSSFDVKKASNWKWRLDATSSYLYSPLAISRIKEYNPNAKFIVVLRNPVNRALSAWRNRQQFLCFGAVNETASFHEALMLEEQRIKENWHWDWRYKQAGCYARYLKPWLEEFDLKQFFFIETSKISSPKTTKKLCEWLEIEYHGESIKRTKRIHHKDLVDAKDIAAIDGLKEYYKGSLRELHDLIGFDL